MRRAGKGYRSLLIVVMTLSFGVWVGSVPLGAQDQPRPRPKVLFEKVVELPSTHVKVLARLGTFPVGFKTPVHTHKGPGPRYVLQGKVEIVEGGEAHTYTEGEVFWESGIPMTAQNIGEGEAKLLIIELLPVE